MTKYNGTDNLEIMDCAVNYNAYLINSIKNYLPSQSRVLDFGAGIGTFASKIESPDISVDCFEPDKAQLDRINNRNNNYFNASDISNDSYDMIYSLNVFEHIEDDFQSMKVVACKLKSSGLFFVYVPAFQLLFSSMDIKVGHFRRYRRKPLEGLLKGAGFKIIESKYVDSLGFFASLVFKIIGSKTGDISKQSVTIYDKYIFPISLYLDRVFNKFLGKNVLIVCKKIKPL
jgi:hypothetical protein